MKYLIAFAVAVLVLWAYAQRHATPKSPIPGWVEAVGAAAILVLPLSLGARALTKKIRWPVSRIVDFVALLVLVGIYWGIDVAFQDVDPRVSKFRLWIGLWCWSWLVSFVPFNSTLALWEWYECRNKRRDAEPPPTPVASRRG